jgi:hypothetical protein
MLWFLFEIIRLHRDPVFRSLADKIHCRLTNETTRRFFTLCRKSSPGEQSKKDALVKQVFEMFLWNIYKKDMCQMKVAVENTKSYFNKQDVKIKNGDFDLPEENELLKCGKKWCWKCFQIKEIETEFNELGTNNYCNACLSRASNWKKKNQEATNDGEKRCGRCSRPKSIEKEFIDEQEIERDCCHSCRAIGGNWNKTNRTEIQLGCANGQKVASISNMSNKDLREEEITKTVVRCVDCHRVKTNVFGENSQMKPLVSEKELKRVKKCTQCNKKQKVALFVEPCEMTGEYRKYLTCNACRQKGRDFKKILAHEKLEFVEEYNGMKLVCI